VPELRFLIIFLLGGLLLTKINELKILKYLMVLFIYRQRN